MACRWKEGYYAILTDYAIREVRKMAQTPMQKDQTEEIQGYSKLLTSSDNLDNITDQGMYRWQSSVPSNAPSFNLSTLTSWCTMQVYNNGNGIVQVVENISTINKYIYIRNKSGDPLVWKKWTLFSGKLMQELTSSDNLNSITGDGTYFWKNSTPVNAPASMTWGILVVHNITGQLIKQVIYHGEKYIYLRDYADNWHSWYRFTGELVT